MLDHALVLQLFQWCQLRSDHESERQEVQPAGRGNSGPAFHLVFAQGPADSTVGGSATVSTSSPAIPDAPLPPRLTDPVPFQHIPPEVPAVIGASASPSHGWFPGMHGTVGALGHNVSIDVPFTDALHTLKGVIPIAVEADKGRFVMPIDFLWMKLGVDNGIPINDFTQTSIRTDLTQSIFTPKVGLRLLDADHLKFDALGGIRYWHLGRTTLSTRASAVRDRSTGSMASAAAGSYCPLVKRPP